MTNYELDDSSFHSNAEEDFSEFISERESNAKWVDTATKTLTISVKSAISPITAISEQAHREAHLYVSNSQLGDFYMRDISVASLLERARVSGSALSELSYEDFAEFVTKCLATAKLNDITKVRVQDGKVAAFMANSYKIVPLPELYQTTSDEVSMQFDGKFVSGIWSHKISFAEYSANLPVSDYNDIFKKKGLNFSDIMMTLSVASSDTGYSGVHIYPKVVGIMSDGQRLSIPILGEIRMDHRGSASIEEHRSNLSLAFAQTERSKKRIKELDSISLNYPFNTFCNVLKSVGIGKKQASSIIDQFAVTYGNDAPATAADVYFKACEITFGIDQKDTMLLMTLEENISKILKFQYKRWAEFDRPVNSWSFNI